MKKGRIIFGCVLLILGISMVIGAFNMLEEAQREASQSSSVYQLTETMRGFGEKRQEATIYGVIGGVLIVVGLLYTITGFIYHRIPESRREQLIKPLTPTPRHIIGGVLFAIGWVLAFYAAGILFLYFFTPAGPKVVGDMVCTVIFGIILVNIGAYVLKLGKERPIDTIKVWIRYLIGHQTQEEKTKDSPKVTAVKDYADLLKDELERDLTLLNQRFSRGEISEETYKELKKKFEERLKSKPEGPFPTASITPVSPTPQPSQSQYIIHDKNLQDNWIKRIIAAIIDGVIIGVIAWIIISMFFYGWGFWGGSLIFGVLWLLYFTFMEGTRGATIGKQLLHLKVVSTSGNMDISKAFIRNISKIFWILLLIDIAVGFATEGDRRQRFLDRYANTVVVKEGESPPYMPPSLPPQSYPPSRSPLSKITIQCQNCGHTGKVDSSFHGQLQCPACHTVFEVREESEEGKPSANPSKNPWFYILIIVVIIIVYFLLTSLR